MTFIELMNEYCPDLAPMTSNKLRDMIGIEYTEPCRRWLRGHYKPSKVYVDKIARAIRMESAELQRMIDEI